MLDKKLLNYNNINDTSEKLKTRGYDLPMIRLLSLHDQEKILIHQCELMRSFQNSYSKARGILKIYNDELIKLNNIYKEIKND